VASDLNLSQFHMILQVAMGWETCHLHAFHVWSKKRGRFIDSGLASQYSESPAGRSAPTEAKVQLSQLLGRPGGKLIYLYDFGDNWEHLVELEEVNDWEPGPFAQCLGGERACPPEDCGGVFGFEELVRQVAEANESTAEPAILDEDEDDDEFDDEDGEWDWEETDFDPEEFDVAAVNRRLQTEEGQGYAEPLL